MVAQLTTADMMQVAHNTGAAGKDAPAWITGDRDYLRAYNRGRQSAGLDMDEPAEQAEQAETQPVADVPAQPPAAAPRPRARARTRRPRARTRPRRRGAVTGWFTGRGGTGGGLLLAVFAYPIGLAVLQHGPAGAGMWFKAKFLNNETTQQPATPGNSGATAFPPPGSSTPPPSSGSGAAGGGGGSWLRTPS